MFSMPDTERPDHALPSSERQSVILNGAVAMGARSAKDFVQTCLALLLVLALIEAGPLSLHHCFAIDTAHSEFVEEAEEHKSKASKTSGSFVDTEVTAIDCCFRGDQYIKALLSHCFAPPAFLQNCTFRC